MGTDVEEPKTCSCCAKRNKANEIIEKGRVLNALPGEVLEKEFKKKGLPLYLCRFCDGDALENALHEHARRTEG